MSTQGLRRVVLGCVILAVLAGMAIPAIRGDDTQNIELFLAGVIVACALLAGAALVVLRRRDRD